MVLSTRSLFRKTCPNTPTRNNNKKHFGEEEVTAREQVRGKDEDRSRKREAAVKGERTQAEREKEQKE